MALTNSNLHRISKDHDKSRKKVHDQQESTLHESSNTRFLSSGASLQPATSEPALSRSTGTGNRSNSEPGPQSAFSLKRPLPVRDCLHSHSQSAIGRIHMRKRSSPLKKDKKKEKENRDSHPLNLPPDELHRLSASMAAQEGVRNSMDAENIGPFPLQNADSPTTPSKAAPGSFPDNANGAVNGVNCENGDEKSPTPPPHRVPMIEKPTIDAEAAKAAGNKFFKAKDYSRAIAEYMKGW
jgi:DnaJ homolog subfamily C member 7